MSAERPRIATRGTGIVWGDLAVVGAFALVGLAVALRRFSWLPTTAP
jgi:hypothetical protein